MRVNISYSVELEEVLENVSAVVLREHEKLKATIKDLGKTMTADYTARNLGEVVHDMRLYQSSLKGMDIKLTEMIGILVGYQRLLADEKAKEEAPPTEAPSE